MSARVLVCGGRDYTDAMAVGSWLGSIHQQTPIAIIIQGGATGADALGRRFAEYKGISCPDTWKANWDDLSHPDAVIKRDRFGRQYDAKAGHRRNQRMLDEGQPDLVIAFPGGTGTADMVRRAKAAGVRVVEVSP